MNLAVEKRRKLMGLLIVKYLMDDEEDDYMLQTHTLRRKSTSSMFLNREHEGVFNVLINNHLIDEEERFKSYFRFSRQQFKSLLNYVEEDLTTNVYNRVKSPITPAQKLAVTLRFLATGESYRSLAFAYRISPSTICTYVPQVLKALQKKLVPVFLPTPDKIDWTRKANEFWTRWEFPNCVAAIDGKHVRVVAPSNTGSLFFNYKGYFSIVLLAMVDANYKFVVVDVGSYGKEGDSGIFKKSKMRLLVENKTIFPPPQYLPNSKLLLPHVIIGDEAFKLSEHIMKPYCRKQALENSKKRTFNYRLSKARRVSENAFGIMCAIFRIFFTPINVRPEVAESITVVCCCLHNMLREEYLYVNPSNIDTTRITEEFPKENMVRLTGRGGFEQSEGFQVRNTFTDYFSS